jgi:hypothetical protein
LTDCAESELDFSVTEFQSLVPSRSPTGLENTTFYDELRDKTPLVLPKPGAWVSHN